MRRLLIGALSTALLTTACSQNEEAEAPAAAAPDPAAPATAAPPQEVDDELQKAGELLSMETEGVKAVDQEHLASMLPETIAGLPRANADSSRTSKLGIGVANAEADYGDADSDARIHLTITDLGGLQGLARLGMDWVSVERNAASADGFERTGEYEGFKTFERYDSAAGTGELSVFIGERFIVQVDGTGVSWDTITDAASALDLQGLDELRRATLEGG